MTNPYDPRDQWGHPVVPHDASYHAYDPRDPSHIPQTSPHFREGQREWGSADDPEDTSRWGDAGNIAVDATGAAELGGVGSTQLVRASVKRPVCWLLQFNAAIRQVPGGVGTIKVFFEVTIGSGMSRTTLVQTITFTGPTFLPPEPFPQLIVPCSDLQVIAKASGGGVVGHYSIDVACMAAPFTRWPGK